jgi:hypothetical protein
MILNNGRTCATCAFYQQKSKTCGAFASQHPVTGEVHAFEAKAVRLDLNKCGPLAKWWVFDPLWDLNKLRDDLR